MTRPMLVLAAFLALLGSRPARATQTENNGIHAVPAPGKVSIDGRLDDWDLSGEVLQCYDLETLKDVYSARIAMMYDASALYVSLHWKDPTPMGNSHHPRYQADRGWAGDGVQLRFKTDRIAHLTAWYYAPLQEPALQISYGKSLTEPFGGGDIQLFRTEGWKLTDGAEEAFVKDPDGRGYVQEIKLPWALITAGRKFAAGDRLQCGIELLWGEADWPVHRYADNLAEGATSREFFWTAHTSWGAVILEPKGRLKLPPPPYLKALEPEAAQGPVAISYTLPRDARVTLAIDDAAGKRVRNLVAALPRKKGRNTERWDGLDDEGKPVPPGAYRYRALYHDGVHANWVMSFANPGNPPWETPDGHGAFYGDHSAPQAVASAGDFVALACPVGEAGKHLIGCDLNGQRRWGLGHRLAWVLGRIALATDGKTLWVSQDATGTVYRVDAATGHYAPWKRTARADDGSEYRVLDLKVTDRVRPEGDTAIDLSAIAVRQGLLAVCLTREDRVRLLDAETGDTKADFPVPEPRALAFDADGSLLVLAKERILRLDAGGKATPFTEGSYPDGFALATDAQRNVYLSVRGADQNVKVFAPDGRPLREIGKRGGRPAHGAFDENGMRNPAGIAIDRRSRLWVTEEASNPKRTSVWSPDGRLACDFAGTTSYAGAGAINPDDPTMAFSDNTIYRIDLAKGTWRPVYSIAGSRDPDALFSPRVNSHVRVLTRGDTTVGAADASTYVFTGDRTGAVLCLMGRGGEWRAAACVGTVAAKLDPEVAINFTHPLLREHAGESFAWADRNGDGLVQADELIFAPAPAGTKSPLLQGCYWGTLPDTQGTLIFYNLSRQALLKLPITGFTSSGAPIYDVAHPQVVPVEAPLCRNMAHLMGGGDGRAILNGDPLMAVDGQGKVLFTYPSHHVSVHGSHTARAPRPGYLIGPSAVLGTADFGAPVGEVFDLNGNLGENYLFTTDGLFIQALFKDTRGWFETPGQAVRGLPMDACTAGGESFGGHFMRAPDGKVYLTLGGTDARVLQLTGLESIRRFEGRFAYSPKQYAEAQRLAEKRAAQSAQTRSFTLRRAAAPPAIDGKPDEWPELLDDAGTLVEIQESAQRRYARVQARYDADCLYLAYRVFSPSGRIRNAGQDPRLLFKSGDCVDLMLAGATPLRLLFSTMADRPVAVLYEKSVPGTPERERVPFSSPWRTITFDRVSQPAEVRLALGRAPGGYFVEAAVPWKRLGVRPSAGLKLKGDFGALFADAGGTVTVSRQYWCNKATGLVNDIPGEAELTPSLWGELILE